MITKDLKLWCLYHSALLPEDYKPSFIIPGLFLHRLSADVRSYLLQEDISDPPALSLKSGELYQSHGSSLVNILSTKESFDSQSINTVRGPSSASRTHCFSIASISSSTARRLPASSSLCWYHRSHGEKALDYCQPCSWPGN